MSNFRVQTVAAIFFFTDLCQNIFVVIQKKLSILQSQIPIPVSAKIVFVWAVKYLILGREM